MTSVEFSSPADRPMGRTFFDEAKPIHGAPAPRLPEGVTRWKVLRVLKGARKSLRLNASLLLYLEQVIRLTFDHDWIDGTPIVFLSVQKLARKLDVTPRQINAYERALADRGLLTWRDSGNHKRYGERDGSKRLLYAYGVDLSDLIRRYDELSAMAEADALEAQLWFQEHARIRALRRLIRGGLSQAAEQGLVGEEVEAAAQALADLPKRFPVSFRAVDLCRVALALEGHSQALRRVLVGNCQVSANKTSDQSEQNVRHYNTEHTSEYPFGICNRERPSPDGDEDQICFEPADAGGPEKGHDAEALPAKKPGRLPSGIEHVKLEQIGNVASPLMRQMWQDASRGGRIDWPSLEAAAGQAAASLCVVIAERRLTDPVAPVRNPGGFARGMLASAERGKLHLHRSVFGLLNKVADGPEADQPVRLD